MTLEEFKKTEAYDNLSQELKEGLCTNYHDEIIAQPLCLSCGTKFDFKPQRGSLSLSNNAIALAEAIRNAKYCTENCE